MLLPLTPATGDWRLTCMTCDEQIVIESATSKEDAQRWAIFHGWSRASSDNHQCPACAGELKGLPK